MELDSLTQSELVPATVFKSSVEVNKAVALEIAELIRKRNEAGQTCVLGLATGSTPVGVYDELIRMHQEEGLSFANVVTFNLDEYYPMQPDELQSYNRFMAEHLFDHVDIPSQNVNIPDGTVSPDKVHAYCRAYERKIDDMGGIDLQLLGIGRTGHIGFNEPGSGIKSMTRLITLDKVTRLDAASDFFAEENVPRRAITMGVGTIFKARRVILIAFGEHKAPIVRRSVEGEVSPAIPATFLQQHPNCQYMLDTAAASDLTRFKSPWLVGPMQWNDTAMRTAVIWLSQHLGKPILKLTDEDYNEAGLQDLLADHGPAYDINVNVFRTMQRTITGWPGGKPESARKADDPKLERDRIYPKRVLIFSPHPDDDVISMGGTLIRLADHGHDVHVAYQTSGSIAVFDDDVLRFTDFVSECNAVFNIDTKVTGSLEDHIEQYISNKQPGQVDSDQIQQLKGLIRRGEARAGVRACGVPAATNCHFLDMPFYETGRVRKKPLSQDDVDIIVNLLRELKPHQVYAAGDLSDPHGTHRVCLSAITKALEVVKKDDWYTDCDVWLYRGAWQEWEPEKIEMAVPLSPQEILRKRNAIFKHESQKDRALFPGVDEREFWQRAEDRNRNTAKTYDQLGLPEYEGIEAFVRWNGKQY
ncbi:MAG TPA: glucosamine-6-phosphate deaminase [Phycisphaerales bacterium]|nr:glucosamine-6-phosphate deaminase [Phycisphaerales bacterium]